MHTTGVQPLLAVCAVDTSAAGEAGRTVLLLFCCCATHSVGMLKERGAAAAYMPSGGTNCVLRVAPEDGILLHRHRHSSKAMPERSETAAAQQCWCCRCTGALLLSISMLYCISVAVYMHYGLPAASLYAVDARNILGGNGRKAKPRSRASQGSCHTCAVHAVLVWLWDTVECMLKSIWLESRYPWPSNTSSSTLNR